MALRGLIDIHIVTPRGCTAPKGKCKYISKTPCMAILQHLCNTFKSIVACSVVPVTIEMLSVRYYAARLDTVSEAEETSWQQCCKHEQYILLGFFA